MRISLILTTALPLLAQQWIYNYNGSSDSTDLGISVVLGDDGNIYAAGIGHNQNRGFDYLIVGVDPGGNERWVYAYNGTGILMDGAVDVYWGKDGNIYSTGYAQFIATSVDLLAVSLTPDGSERWVYRYNGPGTLYDVGYSIIYGDDGNIYLAGGSMGIGSSCDYTVISLNRFGNRRWIYRLNGSGNDFDAAFVLCFGIDGNIYTAGILSNQNDCDIAVISFDPGGNERWRYILDSGYGDDTPAAIVFGKDGNIYLGGYLHTSSDDVDALIFSLTTGGQERWRYTFDNGSNDQVCDLIYGSDNNLYAVGRTYHNSTNYDLLLFSLDLNGNELWLKEWDGQDHSFDEGKTISEGGANLYIAGTTTKGGNYDFLAMEWTKSGVVSAIYTLSGTSDDNDEATSVCANSDNFFVTGYLMNNQTHEDLVVASFPQLEVAEKNTPRSEIMITPTVFTDRLIIHFSEPLRSELTLKLFNCSGSLVYHKTFILPGAKTFVTDPDLAKLSHGVYFMMVKEGKNLFRVKLIKGGE